MKPYYKDKSFLLILLDALAGVLAFLLALTLRYWNAGVLRHAELFLHNLPVLLFSVTVVLFILDLYSLHKMPDTNSRQIVLVVVGMIASAFVANFALYLQLHIVPRPVFILFFLTDLALILLFRRYIASRALSRVDWSVLLLGDRQAAEHASRLTSERMHLRTHVLGYCSDEDGAERSATVPWLGRLADITDAVRASSPDQIVVALQTVDERTRYALLAAMKDKIDVSGISQFIEAVAEKVPTDYLSDTWFLEQVAPLNKRYFWYGKRTIDILVSAAGIVLFLPVLLILSLPITIESRGPLFYRQSRVGRRGRQFTLWKLRTMVQDADRNNVHWTRDKDARITGTGRLLRKVHLDEMPQLWNVLRGDMSFVGPRPEAMSLVELYRKEIPYYEERHMVTPGMTGWAQINYPYGNSIGDAREKLNYDLYYIKNRSFILDAIILLRTIRTVLTGKGAL